MPSNIYLESNITNNSCIYASFTFMWKIVLKRQGILFQLS